jgi:predicted nucleotidyltransferase
MPWRWSRTEDLDLSVAIDVADLPGVLTRLPGWSVNPRLPHRWQAANGLKVDIIPAGPRHLAEGRIVWPGSGAIMNLAGMDLAFRHGIEMGLGAYAGARPVRMAA